MTAAGLYHGFTVDREDAVDVFPVREPRPRPGSGARARTRSGWFGAGFPAGEEPAASS
ncbi:hypothetical protein ABT330_01870 [Streptomyces sp. NPDC000658]|uniref:hypothetical protein n=1 Tax=Streptomyces sp. NPDC000658 TaxID=3154266 RepID=UPI00331BE9F4